MNKESPSKNEQNSVRSEVKDSFAKDDAERVLELVREKDLLLQDYSGHLKQLQADFENYIKRSDREKALIADQANRQLISKFLVVLDDFGRIVEAIDGMPDELKKGISMVYSQFESILSKEGLSPIESMDVPFDHSKHEVLSVEYTDDWPEGTIIEELQKGYSLRGIVVRYAKVKIAKPKDGISKGDSVKETDSLLTVSKLAEKNTHLTQEETENGKNNWN